jgi:hypothetical protein
VDFTSSYLNANQGVLLALLPPLVLVLVGAARFPVGVDLIPASNAASNHWDPGQWEAEARSTALSLQHWTIAIALAAMAVTAFLWLRRRYAARPPATIGDQLEGIHAPDATPPGLG